MLAIVSLRSGQWCAPMTTRHNGQPQETRPTSSVTLEAAGPTDAYADALGEYCRERSEAALYRASLLSQTFVESGLGPEDIIALHCESLDAILSGRPALEPDAARGRGARRARARAHPGGGAHRA